jgi:hypothetical protein
MTRRRYLAAVVAAALLTTVVAGIATAGSAAEKKQRVEITFHSLAKTFVLVPLTPGPIRRDSGTYSSCCWTRRFVTRDGESMEVDDPTVTMKGRHGTFTWHERLTFVDINNGYDVATGPWTITRGTGAYAHLRGHGREAAVDKQNVEVAVRDEGLVDLNG